MAASLYRYHSNTYDGSRATRISSIDGHTHCSNRKRKANESETDYRRRVAARRPDQEVPQDVSAVWDVVLSVKRRLSVLLSNSNPIDILKAGEDGIRKFVPGYNTPSNIEDARGDLLLFVVSEHLRN